MFVFLVMGDEMRNAAKVASMAISEAWEIVGADLTELTAEQRAIRGNLDRRYRERRRPFTQTALSEFIAVSLNAFIKSELAKAK